MNHSPSTTISQFLIRAQLGDEAARDRVAQWLIDEVKKKVLALLNEEKAKKSDSSIISNVLIKLVRGNTIQRASHIGYLRGAIVLAVDEIVIDHWRKWKHRKKKGQHVVSANEKLFRKYEEFSSDVDELGKSLDDLESIHPRKAMVVACRFFHDMTVEQTADELGISKSTVEADWRLARAWLFGRLRKDG